MAAAVADYAPPSRSRASGRSPVEEWSLELRPTEDILAALGASKNGSVLVGFGAEAGQRASSGSAGCSPTRTSTSSSSTTSRATGIGFDSPTNEVDARSAADGERRSRKAPKAQIAAEILDEVEGILNRGQD